MLDAIFSGLSARVLLQDQDLAFGFEAVSMPGQFVVRGFEVKEALFEPYEIRVELASDEPDLDLNELIDTDACVAVYDKYSQPRYFHGVISEAEAGDTGVHRSFYSVVLKPTLHRLQYVSDSRIFQEKTVQDVVTALFQENGLANFEWRISEAHSTREYCVCYGEHLYDFIRRLLAEEGIFFWFEHHADAHRLVLSDAPWSMPALEHAPAITYNATPAGMTRGSYINTFTQSQKVRSTDLLQKDYFFKNPAYGQEHTHRMQEAVGEKSDYKLYDYPGRYKDPGMGKPFTQHKLEAERVSANTGMGKTNNIHLCSGYCFEIKDHPSAKANIMHRIISVTHVGTQLASLEEDAPMEGIEAATKYEARFTTMPQRLPYRAINPKARPQILGSQIATVSGPAGEEIYCDEFGRVKVQFPWDRYGKNDENSSCWIRVAQSSAGGGWGHVCVPRIGNEVVVDFLEGDPDQPVVLGMTFNSVNLPPYELPAGKTKMGLKSNTHKGAGANELSLEDEAGKQMVYMHAQKDMSTVVKDAMTTMVEAGDQTNTVQTGNQTNTVETGNQTNTVETGNQLTEILTGNQDNIVQTGHMTNTVATGTRTDLTKSDTDWTVSEGAYTFNVSANSATYAVKGDVSRTYNSDHTENTDGLRQIGAAGLHFNTGGSVPATSGKVEVVAADEIKLTTGSSSLTMLSDGTITLAGVKVTIAGDAELNNNSAKITSTASGEHSVQGSVLKLN